MRCENLAFERYFNSRASVRHRVPYDRMTKELFRAARLRPGDFGFLHRPYAAKGGLKKPVGGRIRGGLSHLWTFCSGWHIRFCYCAVCRLNRT